MGSFYLGRGVFGIATEHTPDEFFEQDVYEDTCLIMTFQTPFIIRTANGIEQGMPGDCILHTPGFPAYHASLPKMKSGWINDWAYVSGDDLLPLLAETELPVNTLIHTKNPLFLRDALTEISNERLHRRIFWEQRVDLLIRDIIYSLSRAATESTSQSSTYLAALCDLREKIASSLETTWTVQRMADSLSLSKSRFFTIYRSQFGTTPMNDLLDLRIEKAMRLLQMTSLSIAEIAAQCGFTSEYYFSNFFKKKVGVSPIRYRKNR